MKLLNTGSVDVVEDCKLFFGFQSPSVILAGRTVAFLKRYSTTFNGVCQLSLFIGHICIASNINLNHIFRNINCNEILNRMVE